MRITSAGFSSLSHVIKQHSIATIIGVLNLNTQGLNALIMLVLGPETRARGYKKIHAKLK